MARDELPLSGADQQLRQALSAPSSRLPRNEHGVAVSPCRRGNLREVDTEGATASVRATHTAGNRGGGWNTG